MNEVVTVAVKQAQVVEGVVIVDHSRLLGGVTASGSSLTAFPSSLPTYIDPPGPTEGGARRSEVEPPANGGN